MSALPHESGKPTVPSGTVTFVFTDIEGSTERWDRNRTAMQDAVRRHDTIVRRAISGRGGHVFKTVGDAFCAAFSRPEDAVASVLDAQLALAAEDFTTIGGLRVRAAVHVGTADEREGDYFGPAVNRVARLLAIAHGGQVLLSGATADLVQGDLPPQASLRDLGEHRLKDLSRPEYVYQLLAPGLTPEFPALRSLDTLPNNLPRQITSFVGREKEIAEITTLIEKNPLVTIVGSGGVGKTRTSLQVGANLLDGSGDGVWFVELAPLNSGEYIPTTIAATMGLELGEGEATARLVVALKSKRALLIFDNCEHLVAAAADVIAAIVRGCPQIKILASTRQSLGIAGEETYRMPSLGVPMGDASMPITAKLAAASPAVALFVERAISVDKRFDLTDENAPAVAEICRRLDGIALAIELAAARVKILSPRQLRERLDERFRVLTGGSRDVLPRQQTLRALIDWSHDLLDERERTLFRRLGIFANGFTIEGAAAVGSGDDLDELDIFDLLASLVDKSLAVAEPHGDSLRYRLLESTRAYATEKLAAAGERDVTAERHLRHLTDFFAALRADAERTVRNGEWTHAFETDLEDIRAALDRALERRDIRGGSHLLVNLERAWLALSLAREATTRIEPFVAALTEDDRSLQAELEVMYSTLLIDNGLNTKAAIVSEDALRNARESGDPAVLSRALVQRAKICARAKDTLGAEVLLEEAEALSATTARGRERIVSVRIEVALEKGEFDECARLLEDLRARERAHGNARNANISSIELAEVEWRRGRASTAIALMREALVSIATGTDAKLEADTLGILAVWLALEGDVVPAAEAARESIRFLAARHPESPHLLDAMLCMALVRAVSADARVGTVLCGYADAVSEARDKVLDDHRIAIRERLATLTSDVLSSIDLGRFLAEGAALPPEEAIALALETSATGSLG
jgi:predicted ATPase/class 3 adenylate cyclase